MSQKICIIGDGLTSLITALSLSENNLQISLIGDFKKKEDSRVTAISPSNFDFLKKITGKKVKNYFWNCKNIKLYHEEGTKYLKFMDIENDGKNLMYIVKNSDLKKHLFSLINKNRKIQIIKKKVERIDIKNTSIYLKKRAINFDFILFCAGRNSNISKKVFPERAIVDNSEEKAFTCVVKHNLNITNPEQYFFKEGAFAILPFEKKKFSVVWSIRKNYLDINIPLLIKKKLKEILKTEKEIKILKIYSFPISLKIKTNFYKNNLLSLGEGSYNIHPLAGQGFNLILRDIKELKKTISNHTSLGLQLQNSQIFQNFVKSTKSENLLFGLGINLINKFFDHKNLFHPVKKIILKDINKNKFLKNLNLRVSDTGILK